MVAFCEYKTRTRPHPCGSRSSVSGVIPKSQTNHSTKSRHAPLSGNKRQTNCLHNDREALAVSCPFCSAYRENEQSAKHFITSISNIRTRLGLTSYLFLSAFCLSMTKLRNGLLLFDPESKSISKPVISFAIPRKPPWGDNSALLAGKIAPNLGFCAKRTEFLCILPRTELGTG